MFAFFLVPAVGFVCLCEAVFVYTKFVYVKERDKDANKCVSLF